MLIRHLTELGINSPRLLESVATTHFTKYGFSIGLKKFQKNPCDAFKKDVKPVCGGSGGGDGSKLVRAERSGKCRLGFVPDEWFLFFKSKTGVSGPYLFFLGVGNFLVSKEYFVMEHEYYTGLSLLLIAYFITTRLGKEIGAQLDKGVDEIHESFQKGRDDEIKFNENLIKEAALAQTRAKGQKELMTAKKENIQLQLEAVYRERLLLVYQAVKGRMEYHARRARSENMIRQKWMVQWIMERIHQAITPEFQKSSLKSAINELATIADRPRS